MARYGVKGKSTHDARLVATMLANGVPRILTFNARDFALGAGCKLPITSVAA